MHYSELWRSSSIFFHAMRRDSKVSGLDQRP